jgi:hypothetical protein
MILARARREGMHRLVDESEAFGLSLIDPGLDLNRELGRLVRPVP